MQRRFLLQACSLAEGPEDASEHPVSRCAESMADEQALQDNQRQAESGLPENVSWTFGT